jgi:hypothetical protein
MLQSPDPIHRERRKETHEMFGNLDLQQVLRYQDDLRREAAQRRLVTRITPAPEQAKKSQGRRVLGLRLSFA